MDAGRPPTRPDSAPGARWFAGRFELREELGRGAFATVFRAFDVGRQVEVALKVLQRSEPRAAERFRREAAVLERLRHPNIVAAYESGVADGRAFLVEELVRGGTLRSLVATRPTPAQAARLVHDVAAAAAHAHASGVVHRDLKPDNVVIDAQGRPRVIDFGIAGLLGGSREEPALTLPGAPIGTPGYMAPEQVRGEPATPTSDVFALGAILYELLCAEPPFHRLGDALVATLRESPSPPSAQRPEVPPALDAIVLRCLAKDPAGRFDGAAALRAALAAFLDGAPSAHEAPAALGRRPLGAALAALGLASVAVVVAFVVASGRAPATAPAAVAPLAAPPVGLTVDDDPAARLAALAAAETPDGEAARALVRAHADDPRVLAAAADASRALLVRAWELARRAEPRRQDVLDLMRLAGDLVEHDDDACARARLDEAEYLYRRAHHDEALERARAAPAGGALARERALAVARNLRGDHQGEDARAILEALATERPDDVPGLLAAATLRADAWDYPASNALAARALELDPDCRPAMHVLAIGHAFRRGEARALELVARAKALAPDDAHMDVCEAYARMYLREFDAAVAAFTRAMELAAPRPFHKAIKWRGIARLRAGRPREALDDLDACLGLRPRDADVLIYRGVTLLQLGERPRAVADWRAAYAVDAQFFRRRLGDMAPAVRELMLEAVEGR